jgi:hypothetical protein
MLGCVLDVALFVGFCGVAVRFCCVFVMRGRFVMIVFWHCELCWSMLMAIARRPGYPKRGSLRPGFYSFLSQILRNQYSPVDSTLGPSLPPGRKYEVAIPVKGCGVALAERRA